jgi:hypothetical protein
VTISVAIVRAQGKEHTNANTAYEKRTRKSSGAGETKHVRK